MTTTYPIADFIVDRVRAADLASLVERYAPNALLDMNTPFSRFQLQGREAIAEFAREGLGQLPNLHTTFVRSDLARDAVVVEYEFRWDGPDGEQLSRGVSIFRITDDAVIEHVEHCGGNWTPSDIARNQAEAPIVRW